MRSLTLKLGLASLLVGSTVAAQAQNWDICRDPENENYVSLDYAVNGVENNLLWFLVGLNGTVTYGGQNGPCFAPNPQQIPAAGKFAMAYGQDGSIQRTSDSFVDDNMTLTFGAPLRPAWMYANLQIVNEEDDTRELFYFGEDPLEFFSGVSNRYMRVVDIIQDVRMEMQVELVADAFRFRWNLINQGAEDIRAGVLWGGAISMFAAAPGASNAQFSHFSPLGPAKPGYVYVPNQRPPLTDRVYDRNLDPNGFPEYVDFVFGQTDAFGLRVDNIAGPAIDDTLQANKPTPAERFWLGKAVVGGGSPDLIGPLAAAEPTFPLSILPDTPFTQQTAFVQEFPAETITTGAGRQTLHYVRSTWGNGNYRLPFGATVDAPHLLTADATPAAGNEAQQGITPNPFQMRVYVDNVGGFAFDEKEFPLFDVRVKVSFEQGRGMSVQGLSERTITRVDPHQLDFLDFTGVADDTAEGNIEYTVQIDAQPGNLRKIIKGVINVSGTPRYTLDQDANLVTFPFRFQDTSLDAVLEPFRDPNVPGGDYQAFTWDAEQRGYVVTTAVERGRGQFIIYNNATKAPVRRQVGGNPTSPPDVTNDLVAVQLSSGWNLIANPHYVRIPINQLIGVPADANQQSLSFEELVSQGLVSNFVAYYDPAIDDYVFVDGSTGYLEPNRGYWILVLAAGQVSILYPPVFEKWVPDSTRKTGRVAPKWEQTDKQWRLNVVARTESALDSENYVGVAGSSTAAKSLRMYEPPMRPKSELGVYFQETVDGKATQMAQVLREKSATMSWKMIVDVQKPGQVVVTWPNVATVPKNIRFRVTDVATGISREMRQTSGYNFTMEKAGTREFLIEATPGGASKAVIGNVIVSRPNSKDGNSPFTISYTLSDDATTNVRVLDGRGKEVFTVVRGKASKAGENNVTWALKDNANRAVAPGTYRVEIVAETPTGERVRKVVPVNVIR